VVGVTKSVSARFGKGGIADRMIWFNGFPFLDNKEDHSFGVPVSQVMNQELTVLLSTGMAIREVGNVSLWEWGKKGSMGPLY
jgi:chloride channel 3/4/5